MHKGRLARLTRLGGMAAGLVGDVASAGLHRVHETADRATDRLHQRTAARLAAVLGDMKGLPLKAGQMLSYIDEIVPPEQRHIYNEVLGRLQAHTPPMPLSAIREVFDAEHGGRGPAEVFAAFDEEPIAAASIGQVYRARTHAGQEVVVKVQYPGVREAIDADLKNLGVLVSALSAIAPRMQFEPLMRDFMERVTEECDYTAELESQEAFWSHWQDDPAVVIPRGLAALSSSRVLVSEHIAGQSWTEMLEHATPAERGAYGHTIFRFVFTSLFRDGMFNGDPHPGNYLFLGEGRVCFIDYGCVQRFDNAKRSDFATLRAAVLARATGDAFRDAAQAVFPMPPDLEPAVQAGMLELLRLVFEPVTAPQPYRFSTDYSQRVISHMTNLKLDMSKQMLRGRRAFPLEPGQTDAGLAYLGRIAFGLASILTRLECAGDFHQIVADIPLVIA